jgi:TRAP-type uncharacterized transport system fused permease subunit
MGIGFLIPVLILFGGIVAARQISSKATKLLTDEQKVRLLDVYSTDRWKYFIVPIILLVVYFVTLEFELVASEYSKFAFPGFLILLAVYSTISTRNILVRNDFPKNYISQIMLSTLLRYLAFCSIAFAWF